MKNFLPLIIIILIAILFAILAVQSAKIIEGNTTNTDTTATGSDATATDSNTTPTDSNDTTSSNNNVCQYSNWTFGECENGNLTKTRTLTSGDQATCNELTETVQCSDTSQTSNLTNTCVRPNNVTGYDLTNINENLSMTEFEVSGLQCAENYYGTPSANACTVSQNPYALSGCNYIKIEATNANPNILTAHFSKTVSINGSGEDLKNNFQYKVVTIDNDFKTVKDVKIIGDTQIKLYLDKNIKQNQTVLVKYKQHKSIDNGGTELTIDGTKLNPFDDEISVVNNIKDVLPPVLKLAVVENKNKNKLLLLFNEPLQSTDLVEKTDFEISVNNGASRNPTQVTIKDSVIALDLKASIEKGNSVKVMYKQPDDATKHIKDLNNNSLLSIQGINAINNVGYPHRDGTYREQYNIDNDEAIVSDDLSPAQKQFNDMFERIYEPSNYGPEDEAYFNEQYIKSIGAHNPFNYINEKNNINCRIDPLNKNRAICDLGRNQPIKQYSLDELKDNRGDNKDKYILKTKIIPAVNPRCPTCKDDMGGNGDENTGSKSSTNPLALASSLQKMINVEDNIISDKYARSIKPKSKPMPDLKSDKVKEIADVVLPKSSLQTVAKNTGNMLSNVVKDSSQYLAPQFKTPKFKNMLDNLGSNLGITPQMNPDLMKGVGRALTQTTAAASKAVNMDPRFLNENTPTPLTNEIANTKSDPSTTSGNGFIPRLTSFSGFK